MSDRVAVFHQGVIQQIGSPNDLYERPTNRFVAEFLGDNNVFDGVVLRQEDGVTVVKLSDGQLLSAHRSEVVKDGACAVCIRPEAIKLSAASSTAQTIKATIEETIYLGQATKVRVRSGDLEVTATFPGRTGVDLSKDRSVDLFVDPQDIHLAAQK